MKSKQLWAVKKGTKQKKYMGNDVLQPEGGRNQKNKKNGHYS